MTHQISRCVSSCTVDRSVQVKLVLLSKPSQLPMNTIRTPFLTQKCHLEDRERFHSLAVVVVYDVTKATSLETAKSWVKELQRQANPNISLRQVPCEEAQAYTTEAGLLFFETSAKTGEAKKIPIEHILASTQGAAG
ncbi:hypothetical protein DFH29DRAFT_982690 [Suillus ampliporus]|nr:hypothetical protein DFH29DRAFT_982690 [Suillus ampliporus]